jgi:predicted PurR-regulated permease PerM
MRKFAVLMTVLASVGAFAPVAANAASFFTPHAQLVQEINNAYGTQFNVPNHHLTTATAQNDPASQKG